MSEKLEDNKKDWKSPVLHSHDVAQTLSGPECGPEEDEIYSPSAS